MQQTVQAVEFGFRKMVVATLCIAKDVDYIGVGFAKPILMVVVVEIVTITLIH